jgi:signal peptidase
MLERTSGPRVIATDRKHAMSRVHRIALRTGTVVLYSLVALALVFLVLSVIASKGGTFPGGYRPLSVRSGSMEPALPTGSVIITHNVAPAAVKVGDVITFRPAPSAQGARSLPYVTHRVVAVTQEAAGLSFVTQGDANNVSDLLPVPAESLAGRVVLVLPYAGTLADFAHSALGNILLLIVPGVILVTWEVVVTLRERQRAGVAEVPTPL